MASGDIVTAQLADAALSRHRSQHVEIEAPPQAQFVLLNTEYTHAETCQETLSAKDFTGCAEELAADRRILG